MLTLSLPKNLQGSYTVSFQDHSFSRTCWLVVVICFVCWLFFAGDFIWRSAGSEWVKEQFGGLLKKKKKKKIKSAFAS